MQTTESSLCCLSAGVAACMVALPSGAYARSVFAQSWKPEKKR